MDKPHTQTPPSLRPYWICELPAEQSLADAEFSWCYECSFCALRFQAGFKNGDFEGWDPVHLHEILTEFGDPWPGGQMSTGYVQQGLIDDEPEREKT